MAVFVSFSAINVNALNRGASIAVGEIAQPGWAQTGKNNFANGNMFGINFEANVINIIIDPDLLDLPVTEAPNNPTAQT